MRKLQMRLACSCLIIMLIISCDNKVIYTLEERSINGNHLGVITFDFEKYSEGLNKQYEYKVDFEKKRQISIKPGLVCSGLSYLVRTGVSIYPNFDDIKEGGRVELFIYTNNPVIRQTANRFEMDFASDILAYFVCFVKDNKVYTVISKDNQLNISNEIQNEPDNAFFSTNFSDITIQSSSDQSRLLWLVENNNCMGGYIVKSNIDDTIIWLN